jgi:REP element-mobilizing transposase RayT
MAQQPLVIAYHLTWTAYGWWLPNDPRGSGSRTIASDVIAELGELHYGRKRLQPAGRVVREFYERAAEVLRFPLLSFDGAARAAVAAAFGEVIARERYTCYACAVMPDHVHVLIRKHKHQAEEMIEHLKHQSRLRLCQIALRTTDHPTWCDGGWKVFLDHPDEVRRTIGYIEKNPLPLGLPVQRWPFVTAYDDWPLHPGHSPNSPYARRLREVGRSSG